MMMKKTCFWILSVLLFQISSAAANFSLTPFYVFFDADSKDRSDVVRMTNTSPEAKTYRIELINYKQNSDGSYQKIDQPLTGNPFASPYIGFSPRETTLQPRQSQTVRILRKAMAAAPDGEYVSHLWIHEMPGHKRQAPAAEGNKLSVELKALYGVTIPVIIDKGELHSSGKIVSAKIVNSENPYAEVVVARSGNRSFWGNIEIKEGKEILGKVDNFKIFMTTAERRLKIPLSRLPKSPLQLILTDARTNERISVKNM